MAKKNPPKTTPQNAAPQLPKVPANRLVKGNDHFTPVIKGKK